MSEVTKEQAVEARKYLARYVFQGDYITNFQLLDTYIRQLEEKARLQDAWDRAEKIGPMCVRRYPGEGGCEAEIYIKSGTFTIQGTGSTPTEALEEAIRAGEEKDA